MLETVVIEKLVHGGQALGTLPDGRRVFVWNALPEEKVEVDIRKSRNRLAEGVAVNILETSAERIEPKDEAYLSTSPWQIMTWEAENKYKYSILRETFMREHVHTDDITFDPGGDAQYHYRNKMEYSFWADDEGLHLALFHRASHGKRIVQGSSIARSEIDATAGKIIDILNNNGVRGSQLKTMVIRCNQQGQTVAALFVKDQAFPVIEALATVCRGLTVCFSNPKSPASILTGELYAYGDIRLTDTVLGLPITYDVHSFFQVNLPVFEKAAVRIRSFVEPYDTIVDFFSGVGTIGLPVKATALVEIDARNIRMALQNAGDRDVRVEQASAETSLDLVPETGALIVDPPRAGLHAKLTERILVAQPEAIAYLSCNPITQARDLALLQDAYEIISVQGYNFFPRTPHIESLALLKKRR